jgi:hypothetical protein
MTDRLPGRAAPNSHRNPSAAGSTDRATTTNRQRPAVVARVLSHLAVWTVILVPTVLEMARGWRALDDDATISLRSFQVLSLHPPLLGQFSTVSYGAGHLLFDPGPLLYWLLAIPVHLDPAQGGLWGGALCCGLALSAALEAVWSKVGWLGGAVMAFGVADLAWLLPDAFAHAMWNPFFGLLFLTASVAISWVVASGSLGWWPVLVFTASVTAQADLIFSLLAVGLAVSAPILGVLRGGRPERMRWLGIGIGVGIVAWVSTLIQEVTGSPGNLALIFDARGREAVAGLGFGLRSLALAASPSPIWLVHTAGLGNVPMIDHQSAAWGVVALCLVATIAVMAWRTGLHNLATLAAIGVVSSVAVVATFADVPKHNEVNLIFLMYCLWVVGILLWTVVAWTAVEAVVAGVRLARTRGAGRWRSRRPRGLAGVGQLAGLCGLLLLGATATRGVASKASAQVDHYRVGQLQRVVTAIETAVPAGPVAVKFLPNEGALTLVTMQFAYGTGIGWQLTADGWQPGLPALFTASTGVAYSTDPHRPTVVVTVVGDTAVSINRVQ